MSWLSALSSVLFIGHSLIGHENPRMLDQLLAARNVDAVVEAQIIIGSNLEWNWANSHKAEGVDARATIPARAYDVVILTEALPLDNHLKWSDTNDLAKQWHDLARKANPNARVFLQETWHSLLSGTSAADDDEAQAPLWRDRLDQDLPKWQGVVDSVNATGGDMALIPGGQAMALLHDEIEAGTVPDLQNISDLFEDHIHPSEVGFYFMSLVQFAVISGEDPSDLPHRLRGKYQPYDAPSADLTRRLQEIAWEAVQPYLTGSGSDRKAQQRPQAPPARQNAEEQPDQDNLPVDPESDTAALVASGPHPMAVNLAQVSDWSVQQPFLDVFKTARKWTGHLPNRWGGVDHKDLKQAGYLDPDGWPVAIPPEVRSVSTMILTDLPEEAVSAAGRYILSFEGDGIVEVRGRARKVRFGKGQVSFDYSPGSGSVEVRLKRTDRENRGDYVRNITVVKEEHLEAFEAGKHFNPVWLEKLGGFSVLRFMDWSRTNHSKISTWDQRPKLADFSWTSHGVPLEMMLELVNELDADPWFNIPHLADDAFVGNYAAMVRDTLEPGRRAYIEFSNEVWNWTFEQTHWADQQAREQWGEDGKWMQYYAGRATEVAWIFNEVFGPDAGDRLVNVITSQTGWLGLEDGALEAPLWREEEEGRPAPGDVFDAYAVTGYFGGKFGSEERTPLIRSWVRDSRAQAMDEAKALGLTGEELNVYVAEHQYDTAAALVGAEMRSGHASGDASGTLEDLLGRILPYHKNVADAYGLDLIMYEGGTHLVGHGSVMEDQELAPFFIHMNYAPEMGALYDELISGWYALGGTLFNAFNDVFPPSKWGSWGHLRHLDDDNSRWDALEAFQ